MDWYLIHFRSENYRLGVVSRDSGHAGGGFVDFAAVVNTTTRQNYCDLLAENEQNEKSLIWVFKVFFQNIVMIRLNLEVKFTLS
jgi:hypothetical protein